VVLGLTLIAALASWTAIDRSQFGLALVKHDGTTQCTQNPLPAGEYGTVEVPDGQSCTINQNDVIDHDVNVEEGATLNDVGANIGHSLNAEKNTTIIVTGSGGYTAGSPVSAPGSSGYGAGNAVIGSDLNASSGPTLVQVSNLTAGHDIRVKSLNGSGASFVKDSCTGENIDIQNGSNPAGSIEVSGNNGVQCGATIGVKHRLVVKHNQQIVTVSDNTIGDGLAVQGNTPGGATVTDNHAGGSAKCDGNSPFVGSGNTAGKKPNTCG